MIPSILCYVPASVELLGPTTPDFKPGVMPVTQHSSYVDRTYYFPKQVNSPGDLISPQ